MSQNRLNTLDLLSKQLKASLDAYKEQSKVLDKVMGLMTEQMSVEERKTMSEIKKKLNKAFAEKDAVKITNVISEINANISGTKP